MTMIKNPLHTPAFVNRTPGSTSDVVALAQQAYTVAQFCQQHGVSRASFYREVEAGRIATRKLGRRTLIRAEDAKAWLDQLPTGSAQ